MQGLGLHLLVEFYGCSADILNNPELLSTWAVDAVKQSGATYLEHHSRQFEPQGVSGVVIISESHLTWHSWPEYGYIAIDYFTCGDSVAPQAAIDYLVDKIHPQLVDISEHQRGIKYQESTHTELFDLPLASAR